MFMHRFSARKGVKCGGGGGGMVAMATDFGALSLYFCVSPLFLSLSLSVCLSDSLSCQWGLGFRVWFMSWILKPWNVGKVSEREMELALSGQRSFIVMDTYSPNPSTTGLADHSRRTQLQHVAEPFLPPIKCVFIQSNMTRFLLLIPFRLLWSVTLTTTRLMTTWFPVRRQGWASAAETSCRSLTRRTSTGGRSAQPPARYTVRRVMLITHSTYFCP